MGKGLKTALVLFLFLSISFGEEVPVYAIVKGRVEKIFVRVGDTIKKGEPLVRISSSLYDAEIRSLEGKLKELELKKWKAERDYKRYKELYERDLLAESILEDKKIAVEIIKAQIEEVKGRLEKLKTLRSYTLIRSPADGKVVKLLVREGSFVNGSLTPHLIAIIEGR
ncbi:efflux RND transporter periplasmic adaptor subunit [Aquifex sp.]